MSIDTAILNDPKIREVFAASLRVRRNELMLELSKLNSAIDGLNDEQPALDASPLKPRKTAQTAGKRMRKGEPERLIAEVMSGNPTDLFAHTRFRTLAGIAPSTAWRVLKKLEIAGKVTVTPTGLFQWASTVLPVAGGNGKGAET